VFETPFEVKKRESLRMSLHDPMENFIAKKITFSNSRFQQLYEETMKELHDQGTAVTDDVRLPSTRMKDSTARRTRDSKQSPEKRKTAETVGNDSRPTSMDMEHSTVLPVAHEFEL
jgi:hypothetical protein